VSKTVNENKEKKFIIHPASIKRVQESFERSKKKETKHSNHFIEVK